jgi:hypothetical protein
MEFTIDRERVLEATWFGLRKGGDWTEGDLLHFDVVGGESSHCRVEIVPQPHVHIAHIHIGYLLFAPFRKRLQQGLD